MPAEQGQAHSPARPARRKIAKNAPRNGDDMHPGSQPEKQVQSADDNLSPLESKGYSGRKRGPLHVATPVKELRQKASKKKHRAAHTTVQITKDARSKLASFCDRHKLMSIEKAILELLKFYPDTGIKSSRVNVECSFHCLTQMMSNLSTHQLHPGTCCGWL